MCEILIRTVARDFGNSYEIELTVPGLVDHALSATRYDMKGVMQVLQTIILNHGPIKKIEYEEKLNIEENEKEWKK